MTTASAPQTRGLVIGDLRAGVGERGVGNQCTVAGTTLDQDLDAARGQLAHDVGDQGDAVLAGRGLLRDSKSHRSRTLANLAHAP